MKTLCLGILFTITHLVAHASIYRWVDQDGGIHYGELPPPTVQYEIVNMPGETDDPEQAQEKRAEYSEQIRQRSEEQQQQKAQMQKEKEEAKKRHNFCSQINENINKLQTRHRARLQNPNTGEYEFISVEKKQTLLNKYQKQFAEHCR